MLKFLRSHTFPIILTILVIAAYGIQLKQFSFYGDDWIYIYNYHIAGPQGFIKFTQWDRPFSAWIYILTSSLFGEQVLPYHLLLLFQRWLAVVCFWMVLRFVWNDTLPVRAGTILFALYPGFLQQPIAVQYIMHFASLDLSLISIYTMLKATRSLKPVGWVIASVLCAAVSLFTCEYFIGLEFVRPLLLYFSLSNEKDRLRRSLKQWLPCLSVMAAFLFWRVFVFSFQTYQPKFLNKFSEDFINALKVLAKKVISDLLTCTYRVYRNTLQTPQYGGKTIWLMLMILAFVCAVLALFRTKNHPGHKKHWQLLFTGIVCTLASGIPFWVTFLDVTVSYPWDRSTLSFSPGIAMTISACFALILRELPFRAAITLLSSLCVGLHFCNGQVYIHEAEKMNDYFWQLAWRVPALAPGSIMVSDEIPLNRYSDNDLTPIVNWQYAPEKHGYEVDYKYFDLDLREETYYADLDMVIPVDHTYRTQRFVSDTSRTLSIFYREGGCLQVIGPNNNHMPNLPESVRRVSEISNFDLIHEGQAFPPTAIGSEPEHGFCYYYQKVNLALQNGDDAAANVYTKSVIEQSLRPQISSDWLPLILALLKYNDIESVNTLLPELRTENRDEQKFICSFFEETDWIQSDKERQFILDKLNCVTK